MRYKYINKISDKEGWSVCKESESFKKDPNVKENLAVACLDILSEIVGKTIYKCMAKKLEERINLPERVTDNRMTTFDGRYHAGPNEVYIDVITPSKRNFEGPLVVFDNTRILFATHSLCRGSYRKRLIQKGDTPTGRATASLSKIHIGTTTYGDYGVIVLNGNSGDFLKISKRHLRSGICIHAGHTVNYSAFRNDKGILMQTHGCIRVYNAEMKKLVQKYESFKGKKVYCYVEDYSGDISDVYKFYGMKVDPKDTDRDKGKQSNKQ